MAYQNYNNQRGFGRNQQQQSEHSASFPLGGDGKSSMYEVNKPDSKCIASGIFNVEATIAQLRAAAAHPENTRPGSVSIKVFRTGKDGILFASCYPVRSMQSGGNRGGSYGRNAQGGGQRFNWNQQQQQPSYAPQQGRNNFQQQYEQQENNYEGQGDEDDAPATPSRSARPAPRTAPKKAAAPAKKAATRRK